jgi:nitrogen fixation protein FixH
MTDLHADLIDGIRGARSAVVGAAVLLALVASAWGVGYLQGARSGQARSIEAEKQSQEHKGRADAAVEAARRAQADEAQARAQLADADAKAARAAEVVAKLRNRPVPDSGVVPPADPGPLGPVALIDALTSQVEAEQVRVAARDAAILSLEAQRDGWKRAHDERHKETVSLRLALEGQKAAVRGALWRGRVQGFAVGIASGYLAGRK